MASSVVISIVAIAILLPFMVSADTCLGPSVESTVFSTSEVSASSKTVVVIEFTLSCKNGLKNVNLYADINGRTLPATRAQEADKYQVSFSDEHEKLSAGRYDVRLFDEEGYAALRKAQRSGEDTSSVKPLFTIDANHQGVWKGPIVQSEFIAVCVAAVVWYFAFSAKSKIMS
ncbi:translocon-associated protein subunit delta-like [Tubulanus polymorphus]|uniref:translocon-associated protein subunit delta-like n=1 Tax=Tubulanus polymorphus TaxID=672921 RepID=UPI003DA4B8D5